MIDLINLWRIPDEARVVLMPGRLTRWKGHHTLIEAMSLLREEDVFCVIIGADQGRKEYREELESTIEEKGLGGNFRIVDHCEDMPSAYMMSTVVVSASIEPEGFGRIPVESQAMGCPVIATDHGGARETVFPGETGWLVEPGNANAMAQALKEALALPPHQRALMATKGMANVARNFSREIMMERTLDVYAELLSQKQEAARRDLKAA
jgi:glycosyltransferase involved in cell wall biosynthesis